MRRYLISCGGTGGHLAPGIALAEGLADRGHAVNLLISRKRVDAALAEKYPRLTFTRIPSAPLSFSPTGLCRFAVQQSLGLLFGFRHIRSTHPHCIIGFGGFTTASVVLAGLFYRVPVVLHEANRIPGRAIRLLGRFADRVYLPPGVRCPGVRSSRTRACGLPVRQEIRRLPKSAAREALGLEPSPKVLVVLGGSQGAAPLNDWARRHEALLAEEGIQLYCVTGPDKGEPGTRSYLSRSGERICSVNLPFSDRMPEVLSAADLVVSRAGAGTLAELMQCETPAILVPYPHAADNHQWNNARHFEQQGGGIVVDQELLGSLHQEVIDMIFNDWLLRKLRLNLQRMGIDPALRLILEDLEQLHGAPPASLTRPASATA